MLCVFLFIGAWAAGFALWEQVLGLMPTDDPITAIANCARMVKESKVPSELASEAFRQCLEAK